MKKPKNYYCHRTLPEVSSPRVKGRQLQIVQKIGEGSFGQVFKVFDPLSSELMVLKKLKKQTILSEQARILSQITNSQGYEGLKTTGNHFNLTKKQNNQQNQEALVMGCLGLSTGAIMKKIKKMNVYSMKKIAHQLIGKLRQIHNRSYVHRDIKPDNILFGNKYDSHSVYLIDFGLTIAFKKSSVKARKAYQSIVGTARYCPIASHQCLEQYPKDDLESLGYVLLYFVNARLPWDSEEGEDDLELFSKIFKKKKQSSIEDLCSGINCLRKYWTKVKSYKIEEKINYDELMQYFDVGDPCNKNCFQFCQNCWTKTNQSRNEQKLDDSGITFQPKSNSIRASILN